MNCTAIRRFLCRVALAPALSLCLSAAALAQGSQPGPAQPDLSPAATQQRAAQQKSTTAGGRQYAHSRYTGTNSGTFIPKDSLQYYFLTTGATLPDYQTYFTYTGGAWRNENQENYTYDAGGYLTQVRQITWNTSISNWDSSIKALITNNAAGKVTNRIQQNWNTATGAWVNASNDVYTYDAANYRTDWIHQAWSNGAWMNSAHYLYINNASGNIVQQISQNWISGAWQNMYREDNSYDASGLHVMLHTNLRWNAGTGSWVNNANSVITLNSAGMPVQELQQSWDTATGIWKPAYRVTYTYDASGNLIVRANEIWRTATGVYGNYYEQLDTFNSYNQILTSIVLVATSGAYAVNTSASQINYYYEKAGITGAGSIANNGVKLRVYPNPAKTDLHLSLSWEAAQDLTAAITDMAGRTYTTLSAPPAKDFITSLSVGDLPPGNYMLSICGSKGGAASQMITVGR